MTYITALNDLAASGAPFVAVTIVDTLGSTPQERGAKMLVTAEGRAFGTVGGGKIEMRALAEAQKLLADDTLPKTRFFQWNLNTDIGMTCGGTVRVYFEVFNVSRWNIVVFGAGHVAGAVIPLLLTLDCHVTCIDSRQEWLAKLPDSPKLTKRLSADLPAEVKTLPDNAYVLLMTMGHSSDKPILLEILRTRTFPYLGVIGSNAKAKRLKQDVEEAGLPDELKKAFFCPVGLDFGSSHPAEIAVSVAAQLLSKRDEKS
ncbi:MAG TPA: xanthine dehydrogenase accessory protein XdhC [Thermoanaerobaculia bacterium]|nr:xanthine dehydrogenase accessory protein XdhC [Thermoanaerobaculia bacterium]